MPSRFLAPAIALAATAALALPTSSAVAAAAKPPTHVNGCWPSDNGDSVVDSLEVSPSTVDVTDGPATVHVTLHAHDTGGPGPASGLTYVAATLSGRKAYRPTLTKTTAGTWEGDVVVPEGVEADVLSSRVHLYDRQGLYTDTGSSAAPVLTVTDAHPDTTPPTLSNVAITPRRVNTTHHAQAVTVTATATDDRSGVASVAAVLHMGRLQKLGAAPGLAPVHPGSSRWVAHVRIPRWSRGTLHLVGARAYDKAGNSGGIDVMPTAVHVTSHGTNHQPRLTKVLSHVRTLDVRHHARWAHVRVILRDDHGVKGAVARMDGQSGRGVLHRVSGTARHGVWAGRVHVTPCYQGPRRARIAIHIQDVGLGRIAHVAAGHVIARDRTRPWSHAVHRSSATDPVNTWTFSEPVHGISAVNVTVARYVDEQPVAGTWTCHNAAKKPTSCLTGSVVRATFRQSDPPYVAFSSLLVTWEPNHHLDVMDRAGNPMLWPTADGAD